MSLATNITNLATRVATEAKALRTLINGNAADLSALTTTAKGNLVAAINELADAVAGSSGIDDGTTGTTTTWSSSKIDTEIGDAIAALVIPDLLDLLDDTTAATTTTYSSTKINSQIATAIAGIDYAAELIDDTTPSTSTVYSSTKTAAEITAAVSALVDAAPGTLDTLNELAAALGDDANFATTINTALGNRVRVDAVQSFTGPQQTQGRANIDAASATNVGDTTTNFVTTFEAGLT